MNLAQMQEIAHRAQRIDTLRQALAAAKRNLALINKHGPGKVWNPEIQLKAPEPYRGGEVAIRVTIPFGVVQQQALYEVQRIRREIIQLGGSAEDAA